MLLRIHGGPNHQEAHAFHFERQLFAAHGYAVLQVNYPGLDSHPRYERARRLFSGSSGMLSFEMKRGLEASERFMKAVKLPVVAPSLGGVETLVTRPATTSHSGMLPEDRKRLGITDGLIRVSIGIESTEDLLEDFSKALSA